MTMVCVYDDKGVCDIHGPGKKMIKPWKKWTKGKNGLYCWRYTRQIYYICTGVTPSTMNTEPDEPVPTFLVLGRSASQRTSTSTNTTTVGQGASRSYERFREKKGPVMKNSYDQL